MLLPELIPITDEQLSAMAPDVRQLIRYLIGVIEKLQKIIAVQQARIVELEQRNAELEARIADLESRLSKNTPLNSSVPPGSEHPHAKSIPPREKSARKRGGQPGHPKHERKLIPSAECDGIIALRPTICRKCGRELTGSDPQPLRHQVWDVPMPKPIVTEYQQHRLTCQCGCTTCAVLPDDVPRHSAGPRLTAMVAFFMAFGRLSKSRAALFVQNLFSIPASAAWMVSLQNKATAALRPSYEELKANLPQTEAVNCDETGSKEGTAKSWLWAAATATYTVFVVACTRSASVITSLLGVAYQGVVTTDRYTGYNIFNHARQICWAHLKRDFQRLIDKKGEAADFGERLMVHLRKVFDHWHDYRAGKITRSVLKRRIDRDAHYQMYETLEAGMSSESKSARTLCTELFKRWDQLWAFTQRAGVEPTNNRAEQVLRSFVIWRKLSFGTQSPAGSRFVETMLTVMETCRQQQRNLLDFLTDSIQAYESGEDSPSLLPGV